MSPADFLPLDRRNFLRQSAAALAGACAAAPLAGQSSASGARPRRSSLIELENAKPGHDWQLTRVRLDKDVRGYRSPWIEGFCSHQSVAAGDALDIMVSTEPARKFTLEVFRFGYYGGRGARLVASYGPLEGQAQPMPEVGARRVRECRWEPSIRFQIPADWLSGVYFGRLTTIPVNRYEPYWQSSVIFIVRDRRPADLLFQCSDNTWQAYNRWPDAYSLYSNPAGVQKSGADVSFDRPYAQYRQMEMMVPPTTLGSGEFLYWEFPLCFWLEQQGYDVTYCSNRDMVTPERGMACRTFLSVGHDEYWDLRQYHSVQRMIDGGVNALFLSGNSVCYVSPFTDSSDGRPARRISRAGRYGGLNTAEAAIGMGPFPIEDAPSENQLIGARTTIPFDGCGDWVVTRPEHWIFEGTGMKQGDFIPGLVGWEWHADPANIPSLQVVAEGVVLSRTGLWEKVAWRDKVTGTAKDGVIGPEGTLSSGGLTPARWTATIYDGPKGNFVFNASTCWWVQGLSMPPGHIQPWDHWSRPHGPDPRVQRITENLLRRGGASRV
jgi:hypothetical protein